LKEYQSKMGIVKAFFGAMGGGLADQWQEVIEADAMSDTTVFTKGVKVRKNDKRNSNKTRRRISFK
jgi:membrane protease subunit (stomatin/prohibitin family)